MEDFDLRKILRILSDAETSLQNAKNYARRAKREMENPSSASRAEREIDTALSEIGNAIRKLKQLS